MEEEGQTQKGAQIDYTDQWLKEIKDEGLTEADI